MQQVTMLRGDTLVERGISLPPAMMKVDVEGAEIDVLNGCRKILTTYRPIILAEIHDRVDGRIKSSCFKCSMRSTCCTPIRMRNHAASFWPRRNPREIRPAIRVGLNSTFTLNRA